MSKSQVFFRGVILPEFCPSLQVTKLQFRYYRIEVHKSNISLAKIGFF